jgi:transcriptional regulator with XRE-family HTH domain
MKVYNNIRKLRELATLKQQDVASQLGISQKAYSKIENGETEITLSRLQKLSEIFKTTLQNLLEFDEKYIYNNYQTHTGDAIVISKTVSDFLQQTYEKTLETIQDNNKEQVKLLQQQILEQQNMIEKLLSKFNITQ